MNHQTALALANEYLSSFIQHQDIPPGGTSGTAASHGEKTGEFLAALHRALYAYFRGLEEK